MAMKNLKKALGSLERGKKKPKKKKTSSYKTVKIQNVKNIKTTFQSIKLDPAVKRRLWVHRLNTGETITAAINRIVDEHLK